MLGTSVARLALPLYVYACPSNLLRVEPSPALCAALVAWVGLQCGLLVAQHQWGPRCFLPKSVRQCLSLWIRSSPDHCVGLGGTEGWVASKRVARSSLACPNVAPAWPCRRLSTPFQQRLLKL